MMLTRNYRVLIDRTAQHRQLPSWENVARPGVVARTYSPGVLLEGVVLTESSGRVDAVRYEAHQDRANRKDAAGDPDTPDRDDLFLEDDKSYGLCQVMGYNIRALLLLPPVRGVDFRFAFEPALNLALGVSVLKNDLRAVGGSVPRALARYNGGSTGDDGWPGPMRLDQYVTKVEKNCALVFADRRATLYEDRSMNARWTEDYQ